MITITLYTFNELEPAAQAKAVERYTKRLPIETDIAKRVLSDTENYHFEFLEDGTRIQIVEG